MTDLSKHTPMMQRQCINIQSDAFNGAGLQAFPELLLYFKTRHNTV